MAHPEQMLISALLSQGDVLEAEQNGITASCFTTYSAEYEWLINFRKTRGYNPEQAVFTSQFEDFEVLGITDVVFACELVREHHSRQQLSSLVRQASEMLRTRTDPGEILSKITTNTTQVIKSLDTGPETRNIVADSGTDVDLALERLERGEPFGIPYVHPSLHARAWGQEPGDLTVFGARTNQGKSWILALEAAHAVLAGKKVLFWAGEMTETQMRARILTIWFQALGYPAYTHNLLSKGYDNGRKLDVLRFKKDRQELIEKIPGEMYIPDINHGLTTPTTAAGWISQYEPDLLVLDHLTLMGDSTGQRATMGWNVIASITGELKQIATSFKVPIMSASQINRDGDSKIANKPPRLVNLAQSDTIGQDANTVITMTKYRGGNTSLVLSLEKSRSAQAGLMWWCRFNPNTGDFHEITRAEADALRAEEQDVDDDY